LNDSKTHSINTAGEKQRFSSTAFALFLGLALQLSGTTIFAGEPIPGVDVNLSKEVGGGIRAPKGADQPDDKNERPSASINTSRSNIKRPSIVRHEEANSALGQVSTTRGTAPRNDGNAGEASIFDRWGNSIAKGSGNGQIGAAPELPSAAISTTRSNIKRPGMAKEEANSAMGQVSTTRGFKIADNSSPVPTDRGIRVAPGDLNGDGIERRKAGEPIPGVDIYLGTNGQ